MPWPFSRNATDSTDGDSGAGDGRRGGTRDPAGELRSQTRRRLIGAAALLLAAVIVLPMLLDTAPRPVREDIAITIASAPPARKPADTAPIVEEKIAEPVPIPEEKPAAAEPTKAVPVQPRPLATDAKPAAKPATAVAAPVEKFAVQVAALSSSTAAKDLAARLKKGGFSAYVEAVSTSEGTLQRVRVGPFASRDEAQRTAEKIKAAGHRAAVVSG
jgi:DedD protein